MGKSLYKRMRGPFEGPPIQGIYKENFAGRYFSATAQFFPPWQPLTVRRDGSGGLS
jgi:hypothetical protein